MVKEILISKRLFQKFLYIAVFIRMVAKQNSHLFAAIPKFVDLEKTNLNILFY